MSQKVSAQYNSDVTIFPACKYPLYPFPSQKTKKKQKKKQKQKTKQKKPSRNIPILPIAGKFGMQQLMAPPINYTERGLKNIFSFPSRECPEGVLARPVGGGGTQGLLLGRPSLV